MNTLRQHILSDLQGVALSFVLGAATAAVVVSGGVDLMLMGIALALTLAMLAASHRRFIAIGSMAFAVGAAMFFKAYTDVRHSEAGGTAEYEAVVTGEAMGKGRVKWTDVCVTACNGTDVRPFRLRLGIATAHDDTPLPRPGDRIQWRSRLVPVSGGSGYALYLMSQGIHLLTVTNASRIAVAHGDDTDLRGRLPLFDRLRLITFGWRQSALRVFERQDIATDALAVLDAMTLGEKSGIGESVRSYYSDAGASHVLALSGMHLGIIFLMLTMMTGAGSLPIPWRVAGRALAVVAIWLYVWMVGVPVSAVRSALMLTVCAIVFAAQNDARSTASLSMAALLIMAHNPFCVFDIGFQMSFASVFFIINFYGKLYRRVPRRLKRMAVVRWLVQTVCLSCVAQLGVAPLAAYHFGSFPVYFILANLVALPLATVLLYGAALAWGTWLAPQLQHTIVSLLGGVAALLNHLLSMIASLPGSTVRVGHLTIPHVALIYIIMYIAFKQVRRLRPKTKLTAAERGMEEPY